VAGSLKFLEDGDEPILVDLGQSREMVVTEHVRDLGLLALVILEIDGHLVTTQQWAASSRPWPRVMNPLRFETVMSARQPLPSITAAMAAICTALCVWILLVRFEVRNPDKIIVGTVDCHSPEEGTSMADSLTY
jgi:hypothetical protein